MGMGGSGDAMLDLHAEAHRTANLHKEAGNTSFQAARYEQVRVPRAPVPSSRTDGS